MSIKLSELGRKEKWFQVDDCEGVEVKLLLPGRQELLRDFEACTNKKTGSIIPQKWMVKVAQKYLIDIKGITDDNGKAIELTDENKKLILDNNFIGSFVDNKLAEFREYIEEGNA